MKLLTLVWISVTKLQTFKQSSKKRRILTRRRKKNTHQSFFCICFRLSLKHSFILLDFIEQPQFHIQMWKNNFFQKSPCATLRGKGSVAELNRNQVPKSESTVSFNSENCLRMTGILFGRSKKKLSCHLDSIQIQFLKFFYSYTRCAWSPRKPNFLQNGASIPVKILPPF